MSRRPPTPRARGPVSAPAPPRRDAARQSSVRPTPRVSRERGVARPVKGHGDLARLLSVRALLLGVVLLLAFAMVFPTVRAYLAQREKLDSLTAEVSASEAREKQLEEDLARWSTDAYVMAQARERLSYVMPGETAYRVIDPQVVTESGHVASSDPGSRSGIALPVGGNVAPWYATVWESVQLAGEAPLPGGEAKGAGGSPDGAGG
jgi:cell division protein FtsB